MDIDMENVVKLYNNGHTIKSIAEKINVDRKRLSREMKEYGIVIKNNKSIGDKIKSGDILDIICLYQDGMSVKQISKKYSCSRQYINKILYRNKIIESEITDLDLKIHDLYFNEKMNGVEICKMLNIPYNEIRKSFLKNNWDFRNSGRKNEFNENIFECINTHEKAYWLGFLFGDGYNNTNTNTIEITLKSTDRNHLIKFLNFTESTYCYVEDKEVELKNKIYKACRIWVTSKKMSHDLLALGCIPNKSLVVKFPDINSDFYGSFIAGYFDANGSVGIYKNSMSASISSGSKDILISINNILSEKLYINKEIKKQRLNCYRYVINSKDDIANFYNYCYKDLNMETYLDRKQYIFNKILK